MQLLASKRKLEVLARWVPTILICGIIFLVSRGRGPRYQGENLSHWLANTSPYGDFSPDQIAAVRSIGTNSLPCLIDWIKTTDPGWRQKTFDLAGEYAPLAGRLCMPSNRRNQALAGFQILGATGSPAIPELLELMDHKRLEVRCAAAGALEWMPLKHPEIIAALDRSLHDSRYEVRATSAQVLGQAGRGSPKAVAALVRTLNDPHPLVVLCAVRALGALGPDARSAVPILLSHCNLDSRARQTVATLLKNVAGDAAFSNLVCMAQDSHPVVRATALRELASYTNQPAAIPILIEHLHDTNRRCQLAAISLLSERGSAARQAAPELLDLYKESRGDIETGSPLLNRRDKIARALVEIDPVIASQAGINLKEYEPAGTTRRGPRRRR